VQVVARPCWPHLPAAQLLPAAAAAHAMHQASAAHWHLAWVHQLYHLGQRNHCLLQQWAVCCPAVVAAAAAAAVVAAAAAAADAADVAVVAGFAVLLL